MSIMKVTYNTNGWCKSNPAELPPNSGIIANHLLDAIVETVHSERPGYRNALEEDQEQQTEARHGVGVQDLEYVHTALRMTKAICIN